MKLASGLVLSVVFGLLTILALSIKLQIRPVLDRVRRFNRAVGNPRVMEKAGTAATQTAVIRHIGRRSGQTYETPIEAFDTDGGTVVIPLPYGASADWVRNVLAQGGAQLTRGGETFALADPREVPTDDVRSQLPARQVWVLRLFDVPTFLQLTKV